MYYVVKLFYLGNDDIKIGTKCTNYGCNEVNILINFS